MTLSSLLLFTILLLQVVSFVAGAQQKNCPHGLSSMDIAANSTQDLTGKIALVTGGRSGLGYAISQALVSRGCQVIIASRNATLNEQAVEQLNRNATGTPVSYMTFDLESFASVRAFASNFTQQHDRLDFYFGNAGQGDFGPQPITNDGYERIFQVNYVSQVLLIELLLPLLRQTPQSRILLTGSNSHTQACGALGMDGDCWSEDSKALATLPYDQAGLEALNYTFDCPPLSGTYPITKYLMTILARAISKHEQPSLLNNNNSSVSAYAWAPGNINTDLNQWAMCCFAPPPETEVDTNDQCRFQLPYVGPRNAATGTPDPPPMPQINHWVSPAHGTMAPIYAAMVAPVQEAGSFYATYWECEPNQGFTPLGITDTMIDEIYRQSKVWAGIVIASEEEEEEEEIDGDVEEEERNTTNVATTNDPSTIGASSVASSVATSTASSWFHRGLLHSSAMVAGLLVLSY